MNVDVSEMRAAQRAYMKQWRANNPDKVKAAQIRYWTRKAEQMNAGTRSEEKQSNQGITTNES